MKVKTIEIIDVAGKDAPFPYHVAVMTTEDGRRFCIDHNLVEWAGQVVERMEKPE